MLKDKEAVNLIFCIKSIQTLSLFNYKDSNNESKINEKVSNSISTETSTSFKNENSNLLRIINKKENQTKPKNMLKRLNHYDESDSLSDNSMKNINAKVKKIY